MVPPEEQPVAAKFFGMSDDSLGVRNPSIWLWEAQSTLAHAALQDKPAGRGRSYRAGGARQRQKRQENLFVINKYQDGTRLPKE